MGREGDVDFLVMEYLEGETLAERLTKGALPLDQALKYAIEIADALDKAHRQGVTHRELKPANIMLSNGGAPKIVRRDRSVNLGCGVAEDTLKEMRRAPRVS